MSQPEKSADKPSPARLDFKKAAQEILRDHPNQKGHLLIIDPETKESHGSWTARLRARTTRLFKERLQDAFKKTAETQEPVADMIRLRSISAVLLTAGREDPKAALFDLHRQAGRLLVPREGGNIRFFQALFGTPYAAETAAADGYAAIRYLREPGADPDFLRQLSLKRATDFLFTGNPENLSSPVLDQIANDRDFSKMKMSDLIETVGIYARGFTPSRENSEKLVKEFAPLKGKALDEAGLKQLAHIVKASKNPLATSLGNKVLTAAGINVTATQPEQKPVAAPQP
jgi:hypothetical protein